MKTFWMAMGLSLICMAGWAGTVTLTDGSSLSGEIKEQANGDVVVATGAGEITVAKDKIRSIVKDGSATTAPAVDNSYIEGVEARRAKYGNKDGLPRTQNLQQDQLAVTVGQLNYTGDAYTSLASDLSGISYGLAYAHSYTDWVAMEVWGDYSYVSKDIPFVPGTSLTLKLQRYNIGIGPKVQKAIALGGPEQSITLIPSIGLTPVWSSVNASATVANSTGSGSTLNSSSVGASLNVGLDFQFGGALIGAKYRYLVSTDVSGSGLKSSNTSAGLPELAVGFSF
jgi:hypothetical protein